MIEAPPLIGNSPSFLEAVRMANKISASTSPVLILGESGTGKELLARYIHSKSLRADKPLLAVNCSAFNDTLLESELFGYKKGAFTGARENKTGLFVAANHATLLLDEVAEMSAEMQKKVLRVFEYGEVRPVGSNQAVVTDTRILAATNKNLRSLAEKGEFRKDLYFRLGVITIELPPLRNRREDIPALMDHYSKRICRELNRPPIKLPRGIQDLFLEYNWPGNIRELVNELRRVILLESQYSFVPFDVDSDEKRENHSPAKETGSLNLDALEKQAIVTALSRTHGNKSKAAELLGLARRTLYLKMRRHGLTD